MPLNSLCDMEFFKKRAFWAAILNGFLTLMLWTSANMKTAEDIPVYLSGLSTFIIAEFLPNKLFYTVPSALFFIVGNSALMYWTGDKKKLCKKVLKQIIDERFGGERATNRVTLFRKVSGLYAFFFVVQKCLFRHGLSHYMNGSFGYYLKNLPKPFFSTYLIIYARRGQPHEDGSSTFFKIPNSHDEIEGWAPYIFFNQMPDHVDLPEIDLQEIRKYRAINEIADDNLKSRVLSYMKKGRVKSFEKLRTLHRCSRNLWATPVLGEDQELWGVLVFDNELESPFKKKPELVNDLRTYSNFIEKILSKS